MVEAQVTIERASVRREDGWVKLRVGGTVEQERVDQREIGLSRYDAFPGAFATAFDFPPEDEDTFLALEAFLGPEGTPSLCGPATYSCDDNRASLTVRCNGELRSFAFGWD